MNTNWFSNEGGQIAYEDKGTGPLVICVPSIGDVRAEYRFIAPQLVEAGYRVILMDLRGLGESSTHWNDFSLAGVGRDLLALIRELDSGPAVVVGTSMAAAAGIWTSVEEPQSISGLILIGPAVHGETTGFNRLLFRTLFARPWGPTFWVKYYSTLYPTRKPAGFDQYTASLRRNLREPGRIEAAREMILASKSASEERLAQVTVPVQVIMGSKDPDFKDQEAEARWVAEKLRGQYHMVKDAGHYPHAELPEITGPLVVNAVRSYQDMKERPHVA